MSKAFMAQFLELGMSSGGTGSYALSNDLSDFFLGGIEHIANAICGPINKKIIPDLIKMNRGPRKSYPRLCARGISDKAGKELAEVLGIFSEKKLITPDMVLEEHLRERYGLPKPSPIDVRDTTPPPEPPNPDDPNLKDVPNPEDKLTLSERIRLAEHRRLAALRS